LVVKLFPSFPVAGGDELFSVWRLFLAYSVERIADSVRIEIGKMNGNLLIAMKKRRVVKST
jgi:hypothetical protein